MPVEFRDLTREGVTVPALMVHQPLPESALSSLEVEWLRFCGCTIEAFEDEPGYALVYAESAPTDYVRVEQPAKALARLEASFEGQQWPTWAQAVAETLRKELKQAESTTEVLVLEIGDVVYSLIAPILQTVLNSSGNSPFQGQHGVDMVLLEPSGARVTRIERDNVVEAEATEGPALKWIVAEFIRHADAAAQRSDGLPDLDGLRALYRQAKSVV